MAATTTHTYTITGHDAIRHAGALGLTLRKHSWAVEDEREGLTEDEARNVASHDPSMIYATATDAAQLTAEQCDDTWTVEDADGGWWLPTEETAEEIATADDPAALAVVICAITGCLRGEWRS